MKAITYQKYGSPDVLLLKEVKRPEPQAHEVLVKVLAASVNKADYYLLQGSPFPVRFSSGLFRPKFSVLGADVCGVVERVGSKVTQFRVGDEVFGDLSGNGFGTFAEYVVSDEKLLAKKPSNLTYEETAALPMAGVTALQGLRDQGHIRSGHEVLIIGASGGVGSFAIQIAKAFGAKVTAVCSSSKVANAYKLGADTVIDYSKKDFTQTPQQYDLIFDVAGKYKLAKISRLLKRKGRYVCSAFSMEVMLAGPWIAMRQNKKMITLLAKPNQADLQTLTKLAEDGLLKPLIEKSFTLDDVPEALHQMGTGRAAGKLVITI